MVTVPLSRKRPRILPFGPAEVAPSKPSKRDHIDDLIIIEIIDGGPQLGKSRVVGIVCQDLAHARASWVRFQVRLYRLNFGVELPRLDDDEANFLRTDVQFNRWFFGVSHLRASLCEPQASIGFYWLKAAIPL